MNYLSFLLTIISLCLLLPNSFSQNLVQNGDFETYTSVPISPGQWDRCVGWNSLNTSLSWPYTSPDFLHNLGTGPVALPNTIFGSVNPHGGDAVMGIVAWSDNLSNAGFREYLNNHLSSPLTIGVTYEVSFWITNGYGDYYGGFSCDHIGVQFSTTLRNQVGILAIGGDVQYEIPGEVWETSWRQISFTFVADSAYEYITIGNFYDNAATSVTEQVVCFSDYAYYFIDDVSVVPTNGLFVAGNTLICEGDSTILQVSNAQSGLSYDWRSLDDLATSLSTDTFFVVSPTTTTDYVVLVGTDPVYFTVNVMAAPSLDLGRDTTLCLSETLLLEATFPQSSYVWQDGSTATTYLVNGAGEYWLTLSNYCGQISDSIEVDFIGVPNVELGEDTLFCEGEVILLDVSYPNSSYLWQDNSTNPTYEISQAGSYSVRVTNACGTVMDDLLVEEDICQVSIPNAFSPNNDLVNDVFKVIGLDAEEILTFRIYNRWGQEVYHGDGSDKGWNGQFKGVDQAQEVYIYLLKYKRSFDSESTMIKGDVTLLR